MPTDDDGRIRLDRCAGSRGLLTVLAPGFAAAHLPIPGPGWGPREIEVPLRREAAIVVHTDAGPKHTDDQPVPRGRLRVEITDSTGSPAPAIWFAVRPVTGVGRSVGTASTNGQGRATVAVEPGLWSVATHSYWGSGRPVRVRVGSERPVEVRIRDLGECHQVNPVHLGDSWRARKVVFGSPAWNQGLRPGSRIVRAPALDSLGIDLEDALESELSWALAPGPGRDVQVVAEGPDGERFTARYGCFEGAAQAPTSVVP